MRSLIGRVSGERARDATMFTLQSRLRHRFASTHVQMRRPRGRPRSYTDVSWHERLARLRARLTWSFPEGVQRLRRVLIAAAAIIGSTLIGVVLVTDAPKRDAHSEPRQLEPVFVSAPGVRLTAPPGWTRSGAQSPIPGFGSVPHAMLVEDLSNVRLAVAVLPPESPTLLPAALLDRLGAQPATPDRVRLGGRYRAYFYRDLSVPDLPGRLAVFAVPTTAGIATVACLGVPSSLEECAQVADSLRLTDGEPLRLDVDAAFQLRLGPQIRAVDAARERGRRELAAARSPREQGEAATRISSAYGDAAAALAPLVGPSSSLAAIVAQLRTNAATYGRIATHLRVQDRVSLARDRKAALAGEARLKALLSRSD